jgi:hypothetical protein
MVEGMFEDLHSQRLEALAKYSVAGTARWKSDALGVRMDDARSRAGDQFDRVGGAERWGRTHHVVGSLEEAQLDQTEQVLKYS